MNKITNRFLQAREKLGFYNLEKFLPDSIRVNLFSRMQKYRYLQGTSDHNEHNDNPDYKGILLFPLRELLEKSGEITALDFGCGKGRNIENIFNYDNGITRVDGVDISEENSTFCRKRFANRNDRCTIYTNNGLDASCLPSTTYDFVMSTIVFQHIPVFSIRDRLMKDIFRSLKNGGVFSLQMGYGDSLEEINNAGKRYSYHSNNTEVGNTNGSRDVRVTSPNELTTHLQDLGFKEIDYKIRDAWADIGHPQWIYVHAKK